MKRKNLIVCDAHELSAVTQEDGQIELCVALSGNWKSRELKVTNDHLQQMADNFSKEGRDLLFDFDHRCLGGFFSDADSRAAGWGKTVELREGALYVKMQPTAAGKDAIENGEYRYLSPVYETMRQDRVTGKKMKDWRLHSVALTNTPYLTELPAIKNMEGEDSMDELLKLLGATDEESAISKVNELRTANSSKDERICALETELGEAKTTLSANQAAMNTAEVERAIADKKLLPGQKDLATKLINSDRGLYDEFVKNANLPTDLGREIPIGEGSGSGLDKFENVKSYADLLNNPALDKEMETEDPKRREALHARWMKEGK